jgi:hypothetical protein
MKTFREAFDGMRAALERVSAQFVNRDGMTGGNAVDIAKSVLAEVAAANIDNPELPTRPKDVLPCSECGGKKGHVPGCEAGAAQARDYMAERVAALSGRTLRSFTVEDRDTVKLVFEDGIVLYIGHRQIDFSSRGMVLNVRTSIEESRRD